MNQARVLFVGRARAQQASFADALSKRYIVDVAPSGKRALALAQQQTPDVIVLDAISMRTPGDHISQSLRDKLGPIPIVHIHPGPKESVHSPADVVLFLPFTARKLVNSIERLLQVGDDTVITCGPFSLNITRRVLTAHGHELPLTPKLTRLMELFLRHPGQTLERKMLMEQIWETNYLGDTRTLDVHIRWIRKTIEDNTGQPHYLKTVRGVGYCLDLADYAVRRRK